MIKIEGSTRRPYAGALFEATSAIGDLGGWLVDQKIYSNMMAMVAFEIPEPRVGDLVAALKAQEVTIHEAPALSAPKDRDIRGQLVLTFVHTDRDVRQTVPHFG